MTLLYSYAGWVQVAAALLVLVVAARRAERVGLDGLVAYAAGVGGLGGAFIGGHLLVVLADPASLSADPGRLWAMGQTPKAAFGAFAGAAVGGTTVLRLLRQPVLRYADATVPAIVLGYAVYRIGCALQGCEIGMRTDMPWGVTYPAGSEVQAFHVAQGWVSGGTGSLAVHPVGFYHALVGAALYAVLRFEPFGAGRGQQVLTAVGGYSFVRFGVEMLRHEPAWAGRLTFGQWCCIAALALAGIGTWLKIRFVPGIPSNVSTSP